MTDTLLAWHFVGDTLQYGRPVPPDGEWLVHQGPIVPCESGLHASERIIDALYYAPGNTVCRVEMRGEIMPDGGDQIVARERRILWRVDGAQLLNEFARRCALDVACLWDMPDVVRRYLETGNDDIRAAAWNATGDAARNATRDAARAAAWNAAWNATRAAAWDAARAAAWDATRAAAWDAARAAAWNAAWNATRAAAWDAARAAAWDATRDAARAAAWDAARDAARAAQNALLTEMVEAAHEAELAKESEQ